MFFSFDGLDGVGKSTQLTRFCTWLVQLGHEVVVCRDPGSTELGERLREILLTRTSMSIGRRAEMLIYMAARAQLVDEVIRPALAAGRIVVSDRFLLANVVYQAHAGGLDADQVWQVGRVAVDGIEPDLVMVLDMDPHLAAERLGRPLDRIESRGEVFRRQVRAGFLAEAARQPHRIAVIDAARDIETIEAEIRVIAGRVLGQRPTANATQSTAATGVNRR